VLVTYAYVIDGQNRLQGLLTMRDLLLATPGAKVEEIMLAKPFTLKPTETVEEAMRETARRHYPLYPVCDEAGKLIGSVAGAALFEARAFEISAQSGRMVGVGSEERLLTPWPRSLKLRHPWLEVNLVTGVIVGFIVSLFNSTLHELVVLTAFLPLLSSVAGNTGCQTLAVTLRGMAFNEYKKEVAGRLLRKELLLGALNGAAIGLVAGVVMFFYGASQHIAHPLLLAVVVMAAMTGGCLTGGLAGVAVPSILRRFGADPATASSIFLTTTTDIVGMSLFLSLATVMLL
jgi:magnesium transporter